jgi:hypothetical protein
MFDSEKWTNFKLQVYQEVKITQLKQIKKPESI